MLNQTPLNQTNKFPVWYSYALVWWIGITIIYTILYFRKEAFFGPIIGLFVPVGPQNYFIFALPVLITLVLLLIFEFICSKFNISIGKKIILNIIFLFLLTILVDYSTLSGWCSWDIAISHNYNACSNSKIHFIF